MTIRTRPLLTFLLCSLAVQAASAQMERRRAEPSGPVEEVFWAPNLVTTASVTNLPKGDMNVTIMHAFGPVEGGIDELFGLDYGANIRFGLDYGVTDRFSIGIGRQRFEKTWDVRGKLNLLRQTKDDSMPLELAVKGDVAIRSDDGDFEFVDRFAWHGALLVARKLSDRVSLQVSPMVSHFNTVHAGVDGNGDPLVPENTHVAVAIGGRLAFGDRLALVVEAIPVLGDRSGGTRDAFAVGFDLETGGHVFQMFFASSEWLTEQHVVARNTDDFFSGDFRFGFNVNRAF